MVGDEEREAMIQTKQALVLMCVCSSAIGYTMPPAVLFISHLLEIYSSHLSLSDALSEVFALTIYHFNTLTLLQFHKLFSYITHNVDTRDPIGSKNLPIEC